MHMGGHFSTSLQMIASTIFNILSWHNLKSHFMCAQNGIAPAFVRKWRYKLWSKIYCSKKLSYMLLAVDRRFSFFHFPAAFAENFSFTLHIVWWKIRKKSLRGKKLRRLNCLSMIIYSLARECRWMWKLKTIRRWVNPKKKKKISIITMGS